MFAEQGDAVMGFLAVKSHLVAQGLYVSNRKCLVTDLGFLQTYKVRSILFHHRIELMQAGANAVDIKRNDFQKLATCCG